MTDVYDETYFRGGSNYADYGDDPGWRRTLAVMQRFWPREGRVLELGCATGWFVKWADAAGYDVTGVDVSRWAYENRVADTILGDACDLSRFDNDSFDVVVSWEFLEHLPELQIVRLLPRLNRVLKPGGMMLHRIALDTESDESLDWSDDDPTHVSMFPRWWWESQFAGYGAPIRAVEDALNREFRDRDWWGRFFARRSLKSSGLSHTG